MAISRGPKIVTNGLVLALDASDNNSFAAIDLPIKDGLVLWLDAADDSTFSYSSGTEVSQWRDKSGNNFHANELQAVGNKPSRNTVVNGRKSLNFTSTEGDRLRVNSGMVFTNSVTAIVFIKPGAQNYDYANILDQDHAMSGGANGWVIQRHGNGSNWQSWVSNAAGSDWFNPNAISYANNTPQIVTLRKGSSTVTLYSNGTSSTDVAIADQQIRQVGYLGLNIGSWRAGGFSDRHYNGEICEIVVYNRALSLTELKQVHTYLGQKWGISNTDRSIVDISGNNNAGSFGGAAGSQTVANMPVYDFYNKGSLKFDGGDYVLTSIPVLPSPHTSPFTLESFCCPSTVSVAYQTVLGTMSSFSQIGFVNNTFAAGRNGGGGGFLRNSLATVFANTWYHICMTYDGTNASFYLNGSFLSTQTIGTNGINNGVSLLGSYSSNSPSETFNGTIGSARIYNRALTATEVLQNYNAQKSKYTDTVVQSGLMLHLDAENPSSYAGAGTVWYDVSGNAYNAGMNNITPSNWVTYNGVKAFETNDTNNQNFTVGSFPFPQSGRTYEIWINSKSFSIGWQSWFDDGNGERVLFGTSTNTIHVYPSVEVSANLVAGQWYQLLYTMVGGNGTAVVVYKDGQAIGSGTYGYALSSGTGTLFILGDSGSEITSCYCSTVRVYNRVLSAAEVLQNYNATKSRFGL
jgi:hypothetical protein